MSRGFVYILTNEAMKGLVKIGKTGRSVEQRAVELHSTGVPFPFEIYASFLSPDCNEMESVIHSKLAECRVNGQREFFLCDPKVAHSLLEEIHDEIVSCWLEEFMPDHIAVKRVWPGVSDSKLDIQT